MSDLAVAARAEGEGRVLLTHDVDFGVIALREASPRSGVVLVRAPTSDLDHLAARLLRLANSSLRTFTGKIMVVSKSGIRTRSIKST